MISVLLFLNIPAKIAIPSGLLLDIMLIYFIVNLVTLIKGFV
jgi:hypothetical protein